MEDLQKQIEELKKQAEEYLNGWKRAKADLINFQKQTEKEKAEWFQFSQANFAQAILPVVDSMDAAVMEANVNADIKPAATTPENEIAAPFISALRGVAKIRDQMLDILHQMNIKEIRSLGEPPNPEFHEVVGKEKSEIHAPGLIIKEVQKGYLLNGKVLRPSKVIISE